MDGVVLGGGEGRSRREAETIAAEAAMQELDAIGPPDDEVGLS